VYLSSVILYSDVASEQAPGRKNSVAASICGQSCFYLSVVGLMCPDRKHRYERIPQYSPH